MHKVNFVKKLHRKLHAVEASLANIIKEPGQEELHLFRVQFKKMRALIRMLNSVRIQREPLKIRKEVKEVYQICGIIRNLQLHQNYVRLWCDKHTSEYPANYLSNIENEAAVNISRLRGFSGIAHTHVLRKPVHHHEPIVFNEDDGVRYMQNQTKLVRSCLLQAEISAEEMHELRKLLKDLGYNLKYLDFGDVHKFPAIVLNRELLNASTEKLGIYHDLGVYAQLLQFPYVPGGVGHKEESTLRKMEHEFMQEYDNLGMALRQILATITLNK